MFQSLQITRRTSNIGKKLQLLTIAPSQKIVQGYSSKSRIDLEELGKLRATPRPFGNMEQKWLMS